MLTEFWNASRQKIEKGMASKPNSILKLRPWRSRAETTNSGLIEMATPKMPEQIISLNNAGI
jgi:hypothetical protein